MSIKSLYVHIPFCDSICAYCDFCKVFSNTFNHLEYLKALEKELSMYKIDSLDTLYIGGGTPSCLSIDELEVLFKMLKPYTPNIKEYTIEVNPESMNIHKVKLFKQYGINRVSVGLQTFNENLLKGIGRNHTPQMVYELIDALKNEGIKDISIDLIYGLPNATLEDTLNDIKEIKALNISHCSIYSLILEEHTMLKYKGYIPLSDEQDALYYQTINKTLSDIGYKHYEVSNYYKDKPSLHNLVYWHYEDYLGVGLGACSKLGNCVLENTRSMNDYLKGKYLLNKEIMNEEDVHFNKIMMGLRLKEGIDFKLNNIDINDINIQKYLNNNLLEVVENRLLPTQEGLLVLDSILLDIL